MSPPCQPFTQQRSSKQEGMNDPRSRSFAYLVHALSCMHYTPSYLLVENVCGFETSSARDLLVEKLSLLHYEFQEFLLSPTQFDIPNSRTRYYLVAVKLPLRLPVPSTGTILRYLPGTVHSSATRPIAEFLENTESKNDDLLCKKFSIKEKTLWRYGPLFGAFPLPFRSHSNDGCFFNLLINMQTDIVLPSSYNSCCFTKNYSHFVEGTGSILQTQVRLNTRVVWDLFLAKRANQYPDLPAIYELPSSLANDTFSQEETTHAISNMENPLYALELRYFTPREVANLMCFPANDSFSFPDSITQKQQYRLLAVSLEIIDRMPFFGHFDAVCQQVAYSVCTLVDSGMEPDCYSRNLDFSGKLIFQPATLVMYIIAITMTCIMIYHIRSKYTAVGRKEIVIFFYLYMATILVEFLVVSNIIPSASPLYPYFSSVNVGLITATFWSLLLNGFVGFQWMEDGTTLSLWSIRLSSLAILAISTCVSLATVLSWSPFSKDTPVGLFVVLFIFNGAMLVVYFILQVVLVLRTLDNRWPLGDLFFGTFFFICGQVFAMVFSVKICETSKHYIDGLFFGVMFTLLSVMMVYKYWDSITKEDLEFVVPANKMTLAELREPLMGNDAH